MLYWHSRPGTSIRTLSLWYSFACLINKYVIVVFLEHHNTLFLFQTCCLTHFCGNTFRFHCRMDYIGLLMIVRSWGYNFLWWLKVYLSCIFTLNFCGLKQCFLSAKGPEGNPTLGLQAADLVLSTRHLLAMSALPALCNVCCICLEHLLLQRRDAERKLMPEETGSKTKRRAIERDEKVIPTRDRKQKESTKGSNLPLKPGIGERRESEDLVTKGAVQLPPIHAEIPSTLTQVYLAVVFAFLHRDPNKNGRTEPPNTMTLQQR